MIDAKQHPRSALDSTALGKMTRQLGIPPVSLVYRTGSTNADLAAAASSGQAVHLSSLACEHQDAGKGRLGRDWVVPEGAGLTVSLLIRPSPALEVPALAWYTMLAALAWCRSIEELTGMDAGIKWPNDVLLGSSKVCGILAQLVSTAQGPGVVVGTGMNVDQQREELPTPTATSVRLAHGAAVDRTALLGQYLCQVAQLDAAFRGVHGNAQAPLPGFGGLSLRELVAAKLATLGHEVRVEFPDGTELRGRALDIAADGALLVRNAGGTTEQVLAGDVHHVRRADGQYA